MKVLLFGYGSIGQRHAANLKALRPDAVVEVHDPPLGRFTSAMQYDAAIIASPTDWHEAQMRDMAVLRIPFYVEKPMGSGRMVGPGDRCAVGHQYRFHREMSNIRDAAARTGTLHFRANDDLLARYGPDVDGVMAAHPIDTALWLLGPAVRVDIHSDGVHFFGTIEHERGHSSHDYHIDRGPRVSTITSGRVFDLPPNNEMYLDALRAWLEWVEGGQRDPRTATLAEGLAVMEVLAQVKHVERTPSTA